MPSVYRPSVAVRTEWNTEILRVLPDMVGFAWACSTTHHAVHLFYLQEMLLLSGV